MDWTGEGLNKWHESGKTQLVKDITHIIWIKGKYKGTEKYQTQELSDLRTYQNERGKREIEV